MAASPGEIQFLLSLRDQASQQINQVGSAFAAMAGQVNQASAALRTASAQIQQATGSLQAASAAIAMNVQSHQGAAAAATAHGGALMGLHRSATMAAAAVTELFTANELARGSLEAFSEFEQRMAIVEKVTGASKEKMGEFEDSFNSMVTSMKGAASVDFLANVAGQATQLGIRGSGDILKFTEVLAKMANTTTTIGEQGAKDLARVLNITGEGAAGAGEFASALTLLGKSTAATEGQILHSTSTIAQATSQFSLGSKALLGLGAAAASLNFPPQLFGTSVSRALISIKDAAVSGTKGFKDFATATGMTQEQLRALVASNPIEAIFRFAEVLHKLNEEGRSTTPFLTEFKLQSQENVRVLGTISERVDEFRKSVETAKGSIGELALNQENQVALETFAKQLQATQNAWYQFKVAFGGALAPGVEAGLRALTGVLNAATEAFKALPTWLQEGIAWFVTLSVTALGVATAIAAVNAAMVALTGAGITAGILSVAGVFGSLGGAILSMLGVLVGAGPRVALLAGQLLVFGTGVGDAIAMATAAVAAVGAWPITVAVAMAAVALEVYNHWNDIKAFLAQPLDVQIRQAFEGTTGATADAMDELNKIVAGKRGIMQDLLSGDSEKMAAAVMAMGAKLRTTVTGEKEDIGLFPSNGTEVLEAQLKEQEDAYARHLEALKTLQKAAMAAPSVTQGIETFGAAKDMAHLVNRDSLSIALSQNAIVKSQMDDLKEELRKDSADIQKLDPMGPVAHKMADRIDEIKGKLAQLKAEPDALGKLKTVSAFAPDAPDFKGTNVDVSRLGSLSDEDRKALDQLDKQTKVREEVQKQQDAIDKLRTLKPSDADFHSPEEVTRLQSLVTLEQQRVDPIYQALKAVREMRETASAETGDEKNQLEIQRELQKAYEANGTLLQGQKDQIVAAVRAMQAQRQTVAFDSDTFQLGKQIATANSVTLAQKQQEAVRERILDFDREHGTLDAAHESALRSEIGLLQQIEAYSALRDKVDPIGAANRQYLDELGTLNKEYQLGGTSLAYYTQQVENLKRETLEARDPVGGLAKTLNDNIAAARVAPLNDGTTAALQMQNQLRDKGVQLTQEQKQDILDYAQAMDKVNKAQASGIEGWMKGVKDVQDSILDLQKSSLDSISSSLVNAVTGTKDAFANLAQDIAKQFLKAGIDQAIKGTIKSIGGDNSLFGALPGYDAKSNLAAAQAASNKLALTTANMTIAQATLNITGGVSGGGALQAPQSPSLAPLPQGLNYDSSGASLIKKFEGFRPNAYPDPGSGLPRVGYGSDTMTDPATGAVSRTTMSSQVTQAQADADLARRVMIQQNKDRAAIGSDAYDKLSGGERAAITDASYNYTNLPKNVVAAAQSGQADQIAAALRAHDNDNGGINRSRREAEAQIALGQGQIPGQQAITNAQQQAAAAAKTLATSQTTLAQATGAAAVTTQATATTSQTAAGAVGNLGAAANVASNNLSRPTSTTPPSITIPSVPSLPSAQGLLSSDQSTMANALGSGGAGVLGSLTGMPLLGPAFSWLSRAVQLHEGGLVGSGGKPIYVTDAMMAGARRYHTGLANDEFPAILQRGERVLTQQQAASASRVIGSAGSGDGGAHFHGDFIVQQTVNPTGNAAEDKKSADMHASALQDAMTKSMHTFVMNEMRPGGVLSSVGRSQ